MRTLTENIRAKRLIIHKFDPRVPAPGGIDTCIRGLIKYAPTDVDLAVWGVLGNLTDRPGKGVWRNEEASGRSIGFLPMASFDPGVQMRRVPHSLRIALGLVRWRGRIPGSVSVVQSHRSDLGLLATYLFPRRKHVLCIHTQEHGIVGSNSDSFWKFASRIQTELEHLAIRRSDQVFVFNPTYGAKLAKIYPHAQAMTTWFDPEALLPRMDNATDILWVGRMELPKRPLLAIQAFTRLASSHLEWGGSLHLVGAGNLLPDVEKARLESPASLHSRIHIHGRLTPDQVMARMAASKVLLMTSSPGYEGYPRVLVEGMANGLAAVVTEGADTGSLVVPGVNGYVTPAVPDNLAEALFQALDLSPSESVRTVASLRADQVIERFYQDPTIS